MDLDLDTIRALNWAGWKINYIYTDNLDKEPSISDVGYIEITNKTDNVYVPDDIIEYISTLKDKFLEYNQIIKKELTKDLLIWEKLIKSTKRKNPYECVASDNDVEYYFMIQIAGRPC